jgi:SPP1 family predicted phage head-tail adaptor
MNAGKLDRRITLEHVTRAPDAFSTAGAETWVEIGKVWASKKEMSNGEKWRAAAAESEATHLFTVRYSSTTAAMTAADRIICDGKIFNLIGNPREIGRREWFEITAKSGG